MKEQTCSRDETSVSERDVTQERERRGALAGNREGRNASLVRKEDTSVTSASVASVDSFSSSALTPHKLLLAEKGKRARLKVKNTLGFRLSLHQTVLLPVPLISHVLAVLVHSVPVSLPVNPRSLIPTAIGVVKLATPARPPMHTLALVEIALTAVETRLAVHVLRGVKDATRIADVQSGWREEGILGVLGGEKQVEQL